MVQIVQKVYTNDLGKVPFDVAWDIQEQLFNEIVQRKLKNRNLPSSQQEELKHYLLFCEHTPVYTIGKSGKEKHLLINKDKLREKGIDFHKINRGGDITFHGPGQIVGYPILDLDGFFTDIHKYMRFLEEIVIRMLKDYGIQGGRLDGITGVWLDVDDPSKCRKICAMGVRCSRWVTMHGFALNVNTNLDNFKHIVPCGIHDKEITSMAKELDREFDFSEIQSKLKHYFSEVFNAELI